MRWVIIYSMDGGVGKTTIATVLSIHKGRTLLIDADFTKADASSIFRAPTKEGWLSLLLKGHAYVHRVDSVYVISGYDAAEIYLKGLADLSDLYYAINELILGNVVERFIREMRLPVDTIVVDLPHAPPLSLIERVVRKPGASTLFVADERMMMKVGDIRQSEQASYIRYAGKVLLNKVNKDVEKMPAIKTIELYLRYVKMPNDYYADNIYNAVVGDRRNRRVINQLVEWIRQ